MSMTNGIAHGVEIYSLELKKVIQEKLGDTSTFLYIRNSKFISIYRVIWNIWIMPMITRGKIVYSFSTHGSPFKKNQIITVHDLICFAFPDQHRFQFFYFKFIVPFIIKSSKKIVVISQFTKKELLNHFRIPEHKIEVIYNGINGIKYLDNQETEADFEKITHGLPYFITVGASYPHKNVERLIYAIKKNEGKIQCKFIIISKKNDYGLRIRTLAQDLNISNITFLDYVEENLLAKLYKEAKANIFISLYEGFGFPPLEAASLGTLSLVSDIPIMREILSGYAVFINPENTDEIAAKILDIFNGNVQNKLLKKDFQELLSKYSWEQSGNRIIELLKDE